MRNSRKQENILRRMKENIEGNFAPNTDKFLALEKLCQPVRLCLLLAPKKSLTTTI